MSDENDLRRKVHALDADVQTSARHDEAVLASARKAAEAIQARGNVKTLRPTPAARRSWFVPASIAASFALGLIAMRVMELTNVAGSDAAPIALTVPLDATRNAGGRSIPVEQAAPEDWYRYIQELIAAGEAREAQQHLQRFNELHPDFVHEP